MAFDFVKRQPVLRNAPLSLAICQLRFPTQIGLADSDVRKIQRVLARRYPAVEVGRVAEMTFTPAGVVPTGLPGPVFHFRSDDRAWTVTLMSESLSLETSAYVDFTDFLERWHAIATTVADGLELERQDRIGLRYVNELTCPPNPSAEDLRQVVRPELVGMVGAHSRTTALLSSMQELRFAQSRGVLALRHGLTDQKRAVYVLDLDCYEEQSTELLLDNQAELLADFNHAAFEVFKAAVPPDRFLDFAPQEVQGA